MTSNSRSGHALLRACVSLDLRSLALFRVLLALVLLGDGLLRAFDATLLYADDGLYPRTLAIGLGDSARLSLHLLNGSEVFAVLLCLGQALAAAALLVGWQARMASVVALVLLVSAGARTPLALTSTDLLLQALLIWGCFLGWQSRWSLQAAEPGQNRELSWGGAALVLQIFVIALVIAAQAQTPLPGRLLAAGIALLILVPLPLARRAVVGLLLVAAVLAVIAGIGSGAALLIAAAGLALLDTGSWERLQSMALRGQPAGELRLYYRDALPAAPRVLGLLRELLILPNSRVVPASTSPRVERLLGAHSNWLLIDRDETAQLGEDAARCLRERALLLRPLRSLLPDALLGARQIDAWLLGAAPRSRLPATPERADTGGRVALVLALLMLLWNLGSLAGVSLVPASLLKPLALDQRWTLATPARPGWLVLAGETASGREVDPLAAPRSADYARPAVLLHSDLRNAAYLGALALPDAAPAAREALAAYLCRLDAASVEGKEPLSRVRIVEILPGDTSSATAEQRVLWRQDCP